MDIIRFDLRRSSSPIDPLLRVRKIHYSALQDVGDQEEVATLVIAVPAVLKAARP
jgi:hypothetical protein